MENYVIIAGSVLLIIVSLFRLASETIYSSESKSSSPESTRYVRITDEDGTARVLAVTPDDDKSIREFLAALSNGNKKAKQDDHSAALP